MLLGETTTVRWERASDGDRDEEKETDHFTLTGLYSWHR